MRKAGSSDDWLHLGTSSRFDPGHDSKKKKIVAKAAGLPASNSLFVESLIDQLSRLLEKDPKRQRKLYYSICTKLKDLRLVDESYRIDELSSLRGHYRQALSSLLHRPQLHVPLLESSRYGTEFEEIKWLASGGFGHVFQARHRLDHVDYAVKKIKVRFKEASVFMRTLGEVKTLARLNHPNIVQYKAAWLEATATALRPQPSIQDADVSDGIVFEQSNDIDDDEASTGSSEDLALCHVQAAGQPNVLQTGAILYVCMQLCDETLRQWLDRRNASVTSVNLLLALHVLKQAAQGLAYIHSSNVVHHDIKPSNVFITHDLRVQLGDFGLACTLGGGECPVAAGHRGTGLYAAPEQLRRHCHLLSDIFSLGLVLIELLTPFRTDMERATVLSKARERKVPEHLPSPLQELIQEMLAIKPNGRPDADQLLEKLHQLQILYANKEKTFHTATTCQESTIVKKTSECVNQSTTHFSETTDVVFSTKTLREEWQVPCFESCSLPKSCQSSLNTSEAISREDMGRKVTENDVLAEQKKLIDQLQTTEAANVETIKELREMEASNSETITKLRKLLVEKDNEIRHLRNCLSKTSLSGMTCAEEFRTHSV